MFLFKLTPDGGDEFEVVAGTRDVLVWEKTGKGRSLQGFTDNLHMTDLYEMAYIAAKRQGLWDGNRADFEASMELDFEEEKEKSEEADPTSAAP